LEYVGGHQYPPGSCLFLSFFEVLDSYLQEFEFQDDTFLHTLTKFLCQVFLFHLPLMFVDPSFLIVLPIILLVVVVSLHVVLLVETHIHICVSTRSHLWIASKVILVPIIVLCHGLVFLKRSNGCRLKMILF
jgi:hypothetical protein